MITLTLMAIIVISHKIHGVTVREGTIIGSAFVTSSSYWLGTSFFYFILTYLFSSKVSFFELLNKVGYSLFGFCLTLLSFIMHLPHLVGSYLVFFLFGLLSSIKLCLFFGERSGKKYYLILSISTLLTHLLLLIILANLYAYPLMDSHGNDYNNAKSPLISTISNSNNNKPPVANNFLTHPEQPMRRQERREKIKENIGKIEISSSEVEEASKKGTSNNIKLDKPKPLDSKSDSKKTENVENKDQKVKSERIDKEKLKTEAQKGKLAEEKPNTEQKLKE